MENSQAVLEAIQKMLKVADEIRTIADNIQEACTLANSCIQTKEEKQQEKSLVIPLEKVRGILADKSRAGFTAEVRNIIQKHGADRLSEVNPDEYEAIIAEAEKLK